MNTLMAFFVSEIATEHEMGNEGKKMKHIFEEIFRTFVDLKSKKNYVFHVN